MHPSLEWSGSVGGNPGRGGENVSGGCNVSVSLSTKKGAQMDALLNRNKEKILT